jgi:hypothetical protein
MRIAAIACAAVIGLAGSSAWAACDWSTAKASDVVASATSSTPAPTQTTPVRLPETDEQG